MKGVVFIGCGPVVGTTVMAGGCALLLRRRGAAVGVFKPIATKCERRQRQGLISPDAEFLAHCADAPQTLDTINPVRFAGASPPEAAARRTRKHVDFALLKRSLRELARACDRLVVDGGPGLAWPLAPKRAMADLLTEWRWPVVLVAKSGEGVVNELLVHAELARLRGLTVMGTIVNLYCADSATLAEETAADLIAAHGRLPVPTIVPQDRQTDVRRGRIGPSVLYPLARLVEFLG